MPAASRPCSPNATRSCFGPTASAAGHADELTQRLIYRADLPTKARTARSATPQAQPPSRPARRRQSLRQRRLRTRRFHRKHRLHLRRPGDRRRPRAASDPPRRPPSRTAVRYGQPPTPPRSPSAATCWSESPTSSATSNSSCPTASRPRSTSGCSSRRCARRASTLRSNRCAWRTGSDRSPHAAAPGARRRAELTTIESIQADSPSTTATWTCTCSWPRSWLSLPSCTSRSTSSTAPALTQGPSGSDQPGPPTPSPDMPRLGPTSTQPWAKLSNSRRVRELPHGCPAPVGRTPE